MFLWWGGHACKMKKHEVMKLQYGSPPTSFKGCKTWVATEGQWGEGGKVGDSRHLGLAVILKIGLEWAVRGLLLPQSLAGTGKKGLRGIQLPV